MDKVPVVYGLYNLREERENAIGSVEYVLRDIREIRAQYIRLGFHLNELKAFCYYEDFGYTDFYSFCEANFKWDKTTVSRYIDVWRTFCMKENDSYKMWIDSKYQDYSFSQLVEMLPLDNNQRKEIEPSMTIKQIREKKAEWRERSKSVKGQQAVYVEQKSDANPVLETKESILEEKQEVKCDVATIEQEKEVEKVAESQETTLGSSVLKEQEEVVATIEPELPEMTNDNMRKLFVDNYMTWPLWVDDRTLGQRTYRFIFKNGDAFAVRASLRHEFLGYGRDSKGHFSNNGYAKELSYGSEEYYLLQDGKSFYEAKSNKSQLVEYIKEYQKNEK